MTPTNLADAAADTTQQHIYFRKLEIHPIHLYVTVSVTDGGAVSQLPRIVQSLGVTFGNIDRAPLQFSALQMGNVFDSADEISAAIMNLYIRQVKTGFFQVLGANEFLCNPSNLFAHVGRGLTDLVRLPARGMLLVSPNETIQGFAMGVESLVALTLKGSLESAGGFTGALGKGFEKMAADDKFSKKLQHLRAQRSHGVEQGIEVGIEALAFGLASGLTGIVLQPLEGHRKDGMKGLLRGIQRGLVGAISKPISGALEMAHESTRATAHSRALGWDESSAFLQRVRIPRPFVHGRLLTPYDPQWAAECEQLTFEATTVVLYVVIKQLMTRWRYPLRAVVSMGPEGGESINQCTDVEAQAQNGIVQWADGYVFEPIAIKLEDNLLPSEYQVLSITIESHCPDHDIDGPIQQYDFILAGLGLEHRWRQAGAYRYRQNDSGYRHEGAEHNEPLQTSRLSRHGLGDLPLWARPSWERPDIGERGQSMLQIGLRLDDAAQDKIGVLTRRGQLSARKSSTKSKGLGFFFLE